MNEKRHELYDYYSEQRKQATRDEYKADYRQLVQLMKEGRTVADGRKIVLTDDMLDYLYVSYQLMRDVQTSRASKAGSISSDAKAEAARENGRKGGRPRKRCNNFTAHRERDDYTLAECKVCGCCSGCCQCKRCEGCKKLFDITEIQPETDKGCEIITTEADVDHVHVLLRLKPTHEISKVVQRLKGSTAYTLFREYPTLKNRLWGGLQRCPSYYVASVGGAPLETIKKYIEEQREK